MIEPADGGEVGDGVLALFRSREQEGRNQAQGHLAVEVEIARPDHGPQGPRAELLEDLVPGDRTTDQTEGFCGGPAAAAGMETAEPGRDRGRVCSHGEGVYLGGELHPGVAASPSEAKG